MFIETDTSRLLLYRTYTKNDQEEMMKQLLESGYELNKRVANDYYNNKGSYKVVNKIAEKKTTKQQAGYFL